MNGSRGSVMAAAGMLRQRLVAGSFEHVSDQPAKAAATCCCCYGWCMAVFLPTDEALLQLARLSGREPSDPAVIELSDQLVLRGHLTQ